MKEKVYLIKNIEEYGKFISYCINKDISVFRTYWDEKEAGDRCYRIDWNEKRCYYSSKSYFEKDYTIVTPVFILNNDGDYELAPAKQKIYKCKIEFDNGAVVKEKELIVFANDIEQVNSIIDKTVCKTGEDSVRVLSIAEIETYNGKAFVLEK